MKKLHSSTDLTVIELLKAKLADHGIKTMVKNARPPAAGEVPPAIAWPELWLIHDADQQHAINILKAELEEQAKPKPNWQCQQCHEIIDGIFGICWQCGSAKEE